MRRISGGAVWSNRPRTDLARAPVEQSAGATLRRLDCWGGVISIHNLIKPSEHCRERKSETSAGIQFYYGSGEHTFIRYSPLSIST